MEKFRERLRFKSEFKEIDFKTLNVLKNYLKLLKINRPPVTKLHDRILFKKAFIKLFLFIKKQN